MSWDDQRPLSPHLQVYDLPLTAKLSILHRATGFILFLGLIFMVGVLLAATTENSWQVVQGVLAGWIVKPLIFIFIFSLFYHLCTGVRHLIWDVGKGFTPQQTDTSNKVILASSIALTLLIWLIA